MSEKRVEERSRMERFLREDGVEPELAPGLGALLEDLRSSATAWSEAERLRPRSVTRRRTAFGWRPALVSAFAAVLAVGVTTGGYETWNRHEQQRVATEARLVAERQAAAARQQAEEEALLSAVDGDLEREVPAAMEPLVGSAESATSR